MSDIANAFDAMSDEVEAFHTRFNLRSLADALRVMQEECDEVAEAIALRRVGAAHKMRGADALTYDIALEAADVAFTLLGVVHQAGITHDELAEAMQEVTQKNARKTPDVSRIVNGKVQKPNE